MAAAEGEEMAARMEALAASADKAVAPVDLATNKVAGKAMAVVGGKAVAEIMGTVVGARAVMAVGTARADRSRCSRCRESSTRTATQGRRRRRGGCSCSRSRCRSCYTSHSCCSRCWCTRRPHQEDTGAFWVEPAEATAVGARLAAKAARVKAAAEDMAGAEALAGSAEAMVMAAKAAVSAARVETVAASAASATKTVAVC